MAKSIDQMMEDEERLEAMTRHEQMQHDLERARLLRKLDAREGKQSWKMYSENGNKSGIDWDLLRFRTNSGHKSIAQAPRFGGGGGGVSLAPKDGIRGASGD